MRPGLKAIIDELLDTLRDVAEPLAQRMRELEQRAATPGPKGDKGDPGKDGRDGVDGKDAAPGQQGERGADGAIGKDGRDGIDGKDGAQGKDGERGTDGAIGKDGCDGVDGKDGAPGKDGERGADGAIGKDGRDGIDGKDGAPGKDGERGTDGAIGKDGRDGMDGKDGAPGKDGERGTDGAIGKDGVNGIDGKDGAPGSRGEKGDPGTPGRDALDLAILAAIDETRSYPRGTYARHLNGLWRSYQDTEGMKGWECVVAGVAAVTISHSDERAFALDITLSDGKKTVQAFTLPVLIYRGVWREEEFSRGDVVTLGGSAWHCEVVKTLVKPGTPGSEDWKLMVKHGRDGKDGAAPKDAAPPVVRVGPGK